MFRGKGRGMVRCKWQPYIHHRRWGGRAWHAPLILTRCPQEQPSHAVLRRSVTRVRLLFHHNADPGGVGTSESLPKHRGVFGLSFPVAHGVDVCTSGGSRTSPGSPGSCGYHGCCFDGCVLGGSAFRFPPFLARWRHRMEASNCNRGPEMDVGCRGKDEDNGAVIRSAFTHPPCASSNGRRAVRDAAAHTSGRLSRRHLSSGARGRARDSARQLMRGTGASTENLNPEPYMKHTNKP
jgi:hypothetical protein